MLKEIYEYRQMISSMVRKDLRGRYKGSVLGFLWTFINPLLQLVVYSFVFSVVMKARVEEGPGFYLFLFVGLIPWIFFSAALTGGSVSIIQQKDLVKKIYFPREVIPIAYVTSSFVNMLLSFIVVFIVALFAGVRFNPIGILCLPVIMFVEYLMCIGIAFVTSAVTVYFRDLEHILGIVAMAWMYLTPIVYPEDYCPERLQKYLHLNPMTSVVAAYRDVIYYGRIPRLETLGEAALLGAITLAVGVVVFSKLKKHFAEEM